jgi:hypothetical protein
MGQAAATTEDCASPSFSLFRMDSTRCSEKPPRSIDAAPCSPSPPASFPQKPNVLRAIEAINRIEPGAISLECFETIFAKSYSLFLPTPSCGRFANTGAPLADPLPLLSIPLSQCERAPNIAACLFCERLRQPFGVAPPRAASGSFIACALQRFIRPLARTESAVVRDRVRRI